MKRIILLFAIIGLLAGCGPNPQEKALEAFIQNHVKKIKPLEKAANLAYWDAATTGNSELYQKYAEMDLEMRKVRSNADDFAQIKVWKESGAIKDPLLKRQLEILYEDYLENQIEPDLLKQIVDLGAQVEEKFSTFRGKIDGKPVTTNEIGDILKTETDSKKRKKAWEASKQVAPEVADDLIQLVKLRNQAARSLGFDNYHTLMLTVNEQKVDDLDQIFDELYGLTYTAFNEMKADLDGILAQNAGVQVKDLMPWHYHDPFFQETPLVLDVDLDGYYANRDVVELAKTFYQGIGLSTDAILDDSDLYEREGKNPHAFCTDIDRAGDVRILCNVKNNESWMETLLHELGHAVYDQSMTSDTPWLLRRPAHIFTTEAVAMYFGRLNRNALWMQGMLDLTDEQRQSIESVTVQYAKMKQLIFARWAMVMYQFEKQLYANPDQDLNALWWQLVEKYQGIKAPKNRKSPDWAAKIHFTIAPCYYHNYLLGELLASQFHHYIGKELLKSDAADFQCVDEKVVGDFFVKQVFEPASLYPWNGMIERATGEPLTPKYFVEQFVQ